MRDDDKSPVRDSRCLIIMSSHTVYIFFFKMHCITKSALILGSGIKHEKIAKIEKQLDDILRFLGMDDLR